MPMLDRRPVVVVFGRYPKLRGDAAQILHPSDKQGNPDNFERRVIAARARIRQACSLGIVSSAQYELVRRDEDFLFELDQFLQAPNNCPIDVTFKYDDTGQDLGKLP